MSLEGYYSAGTGVSTILPINCPDCNVRLTAIVVNDKCIINFDIECVKCHGHAIGSQVWAEKSDKEAPATD